MREVKTKELIINAIKHKYVSHIPMMYRADPIIHERLIKYFKLNNLENDWVKLICKLGADNFSGGETLGVFTSYVPKYIGPDFNAIYDINHFFIWGIRPVEVKVAGTTNIVFHKNPPLYDLDNVSDILNYSYPKLDWFDFSIYKVVNEAIYQNLDEQKEIKAKDLKESDKYFLNTYCINCIFMTSIFMRGIDKMMMDLVSNQKYAGILISFW